MVISSCELASLKIVRLNEESDVNHAISRCERFGKFSNKWFSRKRISPVVLRLSWCKEIVKEVKNDLMDSGQADAKDFRVRTPEYRKLVIIEGTGMPPMWDEIPQKVSR